MSAPYLPLTRPTIDEDTISGVVEVLRSGWITTSELEALAQPMLKNGYGQYLMQIVKSQVF